MNITSLLVSQKEKETMQDERNHYGAVVKSKLEQQICGSASISVTMKKLAHVPAASGSYSQQTSILASR